MKRLDGKVAIVFGAGPNIGGTVAHFLAREGARVAVSDISADAAHFGEASGAAYRAAKAALLNFARSAAVFLAADESGFLTGIDIPVDGGLRHKYPTWTPGDYTGVNFRDYAAKIRVTQYGEERNKVIGE